MTEPEALELPEQPVLDVESAATLAVMNELDRQMLDSPMPLALDVKAIARAVLDGIGDDHPRIPKWTGDPRELGGGSRPGQLRPDPVLRIVSGHGDRVRIEVQGDDPDVTRAIPAPADDAEAWFLAGLAACREAKIDGSAQTTG